MAFDTTTRNKLARIAADARRLMTEEYAKQLQEIYGIQPDGYVEELTKLTHLDDEQKDVAALLRERIEHLASVMKTEKKPVAAAIDRMTREQAFTTLNRFAALRMCEERGFVQECLREGLRSKGFLVYLKTAGSDLGDHYNRYRAYLFCVFDEIAVDLGVLFDRFSPFGLLFPREPALLELITIINDEELKHIWAEDETIGWIYQYFNTQEERRAMRDASSAPRNSYELAVRNQFFTPRYVVQFLTDNTLGRFWYEMLKGQTSLTEKCQYLVRRPNEIFLKAGEEPPETGDKEEREDLNQEQLLRQPVYIPHRTKKDPREIKILDPACGSGHFLLYSFDLLETIYHEAWDEPELGANLKKDFQCLEDFRKAVPGLILKHNLHGIDIDARCVQIGSLSLWLRAQKAYKEMGLKPIDRPKITKTNIVTAEPMPGEKDLLKEFTAKLNTPALGQLVEMVFDKMQLAGEAGPLLMIEEEIRSAVSEAKRLWLQGPKQEQFRLFGDMPKQTQLKLDFSGISDEQFWDQAEECIYSALEAYAEQAENGSGYQRRLFADDSAQGFAFIDLCRKRYDVVLMNPPFGLLASSVKDYLKTEYPQDWNDYYNIFVRRGNRLLIDAGCIGAVVPNRLLYAKKSKGIREFLSLNWPLATLVDAGRDVMDGAAVDAMLFTAPLCYSRSQFLCPTLNLKGVNPEDRSLELKRWVDAPTGFIDLSEFKNIPGTPFAYNAPSGYLALWSHGVRLDPDLATVATGGKTFCDERFLRLRWELKPSNIKSIWLSVDTGGDYQPWISPSPFMQKWANEGAEVRAFAISRHGTDAQVMQSSKFWFKPGLTYPLTSSIGFGPRIFQAETILSADAIAIHPKNPNDRLALLGILTSSWASELLGCFGEHRRNENSIVKSLPIHLTMKLNKSLSSIVARCIRNIIALEQACETSAYFTRLHVDSLVTEVSEEIRTCIARLEPLAKDAFGIAEMSRPVHDNADLIKTYASPGSASDTQVARLCYSLGCAFGRWDIQFATGAKQVPELPDPFAPLPACPPGMLQNEKELPAETKDVPLDYPLRISWPGILVEDPNHPEDIERRVLEGIEVIWKDKAEDIEHEACEILGVNSLRDYFCKPAGFFADHLKRYSKSRRKAPIYWPISTASGSYTLWIYYHRLTDQTLFTCVTEFIEPKVKEVSKDIDRLQKQLSEGGTPKQRDELEKLEALRQELTEFCDELLRITKLPYKPNLNDGVIITASPLWKLFRHNRWSRDLKACWDKLEAGKYDWAHLAHSIWPERVKEKCKTDRSIAIAHDLEQLCEVQIPKKKAKTKKRKKQYETEIPYDN